MTHLETGDSPRPTRTVRSRCPQCSGSLAVMRVIGGKEQSEYWTMRCVRCGGIHLDIVRADGED